jgi:virginiamycin B lyase
MKLPLRRPAVLLAASVATLAVALPSTALAKPHAKEYPLEQYAVPADITTGPDGALYAPDGSLGRLWRVTTKGKVSSIPVGSGPAGVATGEDGALWVTDRTLDQVHRVTTNGQVTSYQLPTAGAFPTAIVAGPDGALWFTESHGDQIGRITTQGEITEHPIPTAGAFAAAITVGADGALWFTESSGNKIGRITTTGVLTEYPLDTPDALPGPIVTGSDGALYFGEGNTDVITRMTTAGTITRRTPLPQGANPLSLAATPRGLYVAEHSLSAIGSMSYSGALGRPVTTKSAPDAITIGPDGALWYASGNEAKIGRLDLD